jgi:hypothetical protein
MTFSGTKCDCCGKIKGESNHWHQIGVYRRTNLRRTNLTLVLGDISVAADIQEVLDICGEPCLKEQVIKLLRINPATEPE